ncbi:MAG: Veg family protein [Clostridia bacterium]|nr:Veg family protein [Clostridia bacterium]MDD4686126.1 Veg family protein [Clostridia bacterium]
MKRNIIALDDIKKRITDLKGNSVNMEINKGRNKIDTFQAVVKHIYPSVFTVETFIENHSRSKTYSYFDVLCGDVKITPM